MKKKVPNSSSKDGFRTVRVSLTMPSTLRDDLDLMARKLRITRSSFVSGLLEEVLPNLLHILEEFPVGSDDSSDDVMRRTTGRATESIAEQIALLTDMDPVEVKERLEKQFDLELGNE